MRGYLISTIIRFTGSFKFTDTLADSNLADTVMIPILRFRNGDLTVQLGIIIV